jgi:hypothetical protein
VNRLISAIERAGSGGYDLWYLLALIFIASYLGWIALRLRQINETLQKIRFRDSDL